MRALHIALQSIPIHLIRLSFCLHQLLQCAFALVRILHIAFGEKLYKMVELQRFNVKISLEKWTLGPVKSNVMCGSFIYTIVFQLVDAEHVFNVSLLVCVFFSLYFIFLDERLLLLVRQQKRHRRW